MLSDSVSCTALGIAINTFSQGYLILFLGFGALTVLTMTAAVFGFVKILIFVASYKRFGAT
jgi:hypothetical protein